MYLVHCTIIPLMKRRKELRVIRRRGRIWLLEMSDVVQSEIVQRQVQVHVQGQVQVQLCKYKCKFISISDASTWLPKKGKLKIDGKSVWCGTENEEGEDEDGDEDGVRIRKRRIL